jgi:hypothetical protein
MLHSARFTGIIAAVAVMVAMSESCRAEAPSPPSQPQPSVPNAPMPQDAGRPRADKPSAPGKAEREPDWRGCPYFERKLELIV